MTGAIEATSFVAHVLNFHGLVAYALVGGLCFSESAFIIAFFIPGETALVFGGVLASEHHVALGVMIGVAICSTAAGYFVGYLIGRAFGPRLLETRWLRDRPGIARTRATIIERGAWAVVIARFIPFVRAFMPGVAGVSELEFGTFARANLLGAAVWGSGYVLAGFLAGKAYERFVKDAATVGEAIVGVVIVAFVAHRAYSRRQARTASRRDQ